MGTINYKTSDIITLGLKPYDIEEVIALYTEDGDYAGYSREALETMANDYIYDITREEAEKVQSIIDNYSYNQLEASIDYGYYEGFSVYMRLFKGIGKDYILDDISEMIEDLNHAKTMIKDLVNNTDLCVCFPGWSTGYIEEYDKQLEAIECAFDSFTSDLIQAIAKEL